MLVQESKPQPFVNFRLSSEPAGKPFVVTCALLKTPVIPLRATNRAVYPDRGCSHRRYPIFVFRRKELDALLFAAGQAQAALPASDSLAAAVFKLQALVESSSPAQCRPAWPKKFDTWTCGSERFSPSRTPNRALD